MTVSVASADDESVVASTADDEAVVASGAHDDAIVAVDAHDDAVVAGRRCRDCGALAERRYCPECAQATALHPPSVREFVHEFVGHHLALEGSLWRTLAALLVTPGRLTVDYFAGRRQRYIPPLRLYLTFSVILFAVSNLQGGGLKLGNESIAFRPLDASEKQKVAAFVERPHGVRGNGLLDRMTSRLESMTPEQRTERITAGVRQYLPYALIVLVPVLALLLTMLYWTSGLLYGEHLVVAFHAQTVAFIFAIVSAAPMGDWIGSLWVVGLFAHGTVALRRVYGGGWITTVLRELVLMIVYSVVVGLTLAGIAIASLAL